MPRKYYYGFLSTKFHHNRIEIEFRSARKNAQDSRGMGFGLMAGTIGRPPKLSNHSMKTLRHAVKHPCETYG
jgi:hypothetical protein